jgi:hypothetical protein
VSWPVARSFAGELYRFFGSHYVSYLRLARGPCNTQATQELVLIPPHEVECAYLHVILDSVFVGMRLEGIVGILLFFVSR